MNRLNISIITILSFITVILGVQLTTTTNSAPDVYTPQVQTDTRVTPSDSIPVFSLRDFNNAIVNIAEKTNPTVVTITTSQTVRQRVQSPFSLFFGDPRYDQEREFQRSGLGSGVIVSEDGYIITNNHVIDNADEINVIMFNGDELTAEVVGADPASDVAVLKVSATRLPAIKMGNSDNLRTGEMVLAIGSPLSQQFAHTVSMGIVSASGRSSLGLNQYENYIQTDAAINPGNSGGALINLDGELVGINTAIASRSGGSQGIGFAIPINMARNVMEALITDGRVARGFLGISHGGDVDRVMARALGLQQSYGFVVGSVTPDGPAEKAGIEVGDVILKKNGSPIRDFFNFRVTIANSAPGTEIELEIARDGRTRTVKVKLDEQPADAMIASVNPQQQEDLEKELGFAVQNIPDNIRQQLRGQTNGVIVSSIEQGSKAYRQGLRQNDIISQVQNTPVSNTDEFYGAIRSLKNANEEVALIRITRQGQNLFIAFEL